jgi:hypothetical protein
MATYRVTFRVNDVIFTDTYETEQAAFEQAKAWAEAGLTDVSVTDGEREYSFDEFAARKTAAGDRNDAKGT